MKTKIDLRKRNMFAVSFFKGSMSTEPNPLELLKRSLRDLTTTFYFRERLSRFCTALQSAAPVPEASRVGGADERGHRESAEVHPQLTLGWQLFPRPCHSLPPFPGALQALIFERLVKPSLACSPQTVSFSICLLVQRRV